VKGASVGRGVASNDGSGGTSVAVSDGMAVGGGGAVLGGSGVGLPNCTACSAWGGTGVRAMLVGDDRRACSVASNAATDGFARQLAPSSSHSPDAAPHAAAATIIAASAAHNMAR
jgi:hypothetical protein